MKIAVIGCGWLGFPMARELANNSFEILGSSRDERRFSELKNANIEPFIYDGVNNSELPQNVKQADWVIICFPPKGAKDYADQIKALIDQLDTGVKIIFTSSTGVYPNAALTLNEEAEIIPDHIVYLAEEAIRNSGNPYIILRLAGLIGPNRHPVRFLSGREIENGEHPVNLVQLTDIIEAVKTIISANKTNVTYNISAPEHPTKKAYYTQMAYEMALAPPVYFAKTDSNGKVVDGSKITKELNFNYKVSIYSVSKD